MLKPLHTSMIITAVFIIGISAGVGAMVFVWPPVEAKLFPPHPAPHTPEDFVRNAVVRIDKTVGGMTPEQTQQMEAVVKDAQNQREQMHQKWIPAYTKACDEYMDVRTQEMTEFQSARPALSAEEDAKFKAILGDEKYAKLEADRAKMQQQHRQGPPRQPLGCSQNQQHDHNHDLGPHGGPNGRGGPGGPEPGPHYPLW